MARKKKKKVTDFIPRITQADITRARKAQPARLSFIVWNNRDKKK